MMNSKVYTCASESVLAQSIPIPKFKYYSRKKIPCTSYEQLYGDLQSLQEKHLLSPKMLGLEELAADTTRKRIKKIFSALKFCLDELGFWLGLKAAQSYSCNENGICNETAADSITCRKLDLLSQGIVESFSLDSFHAFSTYVPSGPEWSIGSNVEANMDAGLLTSKVVCLIESLLEYRDLEDIRCIVFVERVITAVALHYLLNELLPKYNSWKSKYIAGNNYSGLQSQTRKKQNEIVEEFRKGMVNIIVATSILEEGLDVQSCNLVIRFDHPSTVCSFIQSRGRARMQHSDYILMIDSEDSATRSRLEKYLDSVDIMRKASLCHALVPCSPLDQSSLNDEEVYSVESTGATVTLSSSVGLIQFYCSRLPSDCYFKPAPRWDEKTLTLHLPKSCPLQKVVVQENINSRIVKQTACLEACKKLHEIGALTDHLVPDIVVEEGDAKECGNEPYIEEQPCYFPAELVGCRPNNSMYHCYLIELKQKFVYDVPVHDIVLVMRSELDSDLVGSMHFDLDVDTGSLAVNFKYVGVTHLNPELVLMCRRFQITLLRVLIDHNLNNLKDLLDGDYPGDDIEIDYLLLPAAGKDRRPLIIEWERITPLLFSSEKYCEYHHFNNCSLPKGVQTKHGCVCICMLRNSLVYTPHNGHVYCISGISGLNGNSLLKTRDGRSVTYKKYYEERHGIKLCFDQDSLLEGRRIFQVQNYLTQRCRKRKERESSYTSVQLPPELCSIIMSPISISTFYSFSLVPSIMHRLESLLIAVNFRNMHLDHCTQNDVIPVIKVLEAITTKKCQEAFNLESLETLGDSFLKYAVTLCKFGCDRKLPGFIRSECFDPKKWIIPGDRSGSYALSEERLPSRRKIYVKESRKLKSKRVADVVEALIGAFLSTGGESAALSLMDWMGIKVDFHITPYERISNTLDGYAEKLLNVKHLESMLNYSFCDPSLLVEALTHGSYMLPDIPRCYQLSFVALEFLGDSVLDYLMTMYFYYKYPGLTPKLLTGMRSASTNNDCYARSAIKFELHKHILHASQGLHRHVVKTVNNFEKLSSESTFGWDSETTFPKVLGDVVESLAGAILVDSGYNREIVFQSIRPLLEPLITPETLIFHPAMELTELCQKRQYHMKEPIIKSCNECMTSITIEVEANGISFKHTATAANKRTAKMIASKVVLKSLKEQIL
ncbi:hypothetical protein SLA2020_444960 [Shorea laevis]